jgi:hypothetical protein
MSFNKEVDPSQLKIKDRIAILEDKFQNAARQGISSARFGLFTTAYSDHLPIKISFKDKRMMSWNMLADMHLGNNFMNVSGFTLLMTLAKKSRKDILDGDRVVSKGNIYAKGMHLFLKEFAKFAIAAKSPTNEITINDELLEQFVRSDPSKAVDRREIVNLISTSTDSNRHEYHVALMHSCQIQEHLNSTLKWNKRYEYLAKDKSLIRELRSKDFITLQECSDPQGILDTLNAEDLKAGMKPTYNMIVQNISGDDNCVIIYNANKYQIAREPDKFGLGARKNKPCILCKFEKIDPSALQKEQFIIGSVHHPGGGKEFELDTILSRIQQLQSPDETLPYCISGDYNNTVETITTALERLSSSSAHFHSIGSKGGTMSGPDYGNVNKAIDGALSSEAEILVSKIAQPIAKPATSTINIHLSFIDSLHSTKEATKTEPKESEELRAGFCR